MMPDIWNLIDYLSEELDELHARWSEPSRALLR